MSEDIFQILQKVSRSGPSSNYSNRYGLSPDHIQIRFGKIKYLLEQDTKGTNLLEQDTKGTKQPRNKSVLSAN